MRLFSWCLFSLLFTVHVALADTKITQLPLGSAASSSTQSVFPYVDITDNTTKKLKLSDLINLPAFASGYTAPFCSAFASLPSACSGSQVAVGIDVHGNAICTTPAGGITTISVASANGFAGSSSGGSTPALTISTSITGITKGNGAALSAAVAGTDYEVPLTFSAPLNRTTNTITCITATGSVAGCLAAADFVTFNAKQAALTFGNLSDVGTDGITVGNGSGAVIGSGTTISQHVADATHNGFLASADYVSFSSGAGGLTSWGTFGSTPNSAGASLATGVGTLQPADGTHPGGIALGAQTLGSGAKTVADIVDSGLTASTVPYADSGKKLVSSSVTPTELGYVSGVTSAIQTQFSGKQATGSYITATTGDVTSAGPGSVAATVAQIQGTVVSGTTGSTNVVFSSAPTLSNPVVGTQTTGDNSTKAASTAFVQASLNQLNPAAAAFAASTANIPGTYLNAVGGVCVGDTFTVTATGALSIDGQAPAAGKRVLLKNQTSGFQNGIWDVTVAGTTGVSPVLTRSMDWDSSADMNAGNLIPVINGTANANTVWFQTAAITTCNSDSEVFTQFVGGTTSPLTTKGDLYAYSTTNARLPVGTNNQILTPNSGSATGLNWVTALPTAAVPAFSGDVSIAAGTLTTVLGIGAVTPSKLNTITDGVTLDQSGSGSTLEVKTNGVANAQLAQMVANTIKGNNTGSTANAADLSVTQATAMLNTMVGDSGSGGTKGLAPAPASGDAAARKRLGADGTWDAQGLGSFASINLATLDTSGNSWANDKPNNSDAESAIGDWAAYSGATLTGGSPNTTCTRNTSSPIDGAADFLMTVTTGSSRAGEGCSLLINIPTAYRGKAIRVVFPYITTGTIAAGDYVLTGYDVTNSAALAASTTVSAVSGSAGSVYADFVTQSTTAQLRLGINIARSSTGAATVEWDDFQVQPDLVQANVPVSDWVTYAPTYTGFGTVSTSSMFSRRVGDSLEVTGYFQAGTTTATQAQMTLGSQGTNGSVTIDNTKMANGLVCGTVVANQSSTTYFGAYAAASAGNYITFNRQTSTTDGTTAVNGSAFPTSSFIHVNCRVAISGWSSGGGTSPILSMTDWQPFSMTITGSTSNPTKATSPALDQGYWRRVGDSMIIRYEYGQSNNTGAAAGSGLYQFALPSGYTIDTSKVSVSTGNATARSVGSSICGDGTTVYTGNVWARTTTTLALATMDTSNTQVGSSTCSFGNTQASIGFEAIVPISGWTSTSSGTLTAPRSEVTVDSGNGYGSSNTKIRRFSNIRKNIGPAITYADSAANGALFTINEAGIYCIQYNDLASGGGEALGVVINDSIGGTTSVSSGSYATGLRAYSTNGSANLAALVQWCGNLNVADTVDFHTDGAPNSGGAGCMATLVKVSN